MRPSRQVEIRMSARRAQCTCHIEGLRRPCHESVTDFALSKCGLLVWASRVLGRQAVSGRHTPAVTCPCEPSSLTAKTVDLALRCRKSVQRSCRCVACLNGRQRALIVLLAERCRVVKSGQLACQACHPWIEQLQRICILLRDEGLGRDSRSTPRTDSAAILLQTPRPV